MTWVICSLFLLLSLASPPAAKAIADTPIIAGESDSVGFSTVWREIIKEAGIDAAMLEVPNERKRRLFVAGRIQLDCCAAPQWRTRPEEVEAQLWSKTFYVTREHFLFKAGAPFNVATSADLQKLRVATVQGFEYEDQNHFGTEVAGITIEDVFRLLDAGRADIGIVSNVDFYLLAPKLSGNFILGPVRIRAPQKIRVHRSSSHLLPLIDDAIMRLKREGRIIAILEGMPAN